MVVEKQFPLPSIVVMFENGHPIRTPPRRRISLAVLPEKTSYEKFLKIITTCSRTQSKATNKLCIVQPSSRFGDEARSQPTYNELHVTSSSRRLVWPRQTLAFRFPNDALRETERFSTVLDDGGSPSIHRRFWADGGGSFDVPWRRRSLSGNSLPINGERNRRDELP